VGNTFVGSTSPDGNSWAVCGSATITMPDPIYFGLAVTAHNESVLNVSAFSNVQLIPPPPLLGISWLPGRTAELQFNPTAGFNYRIEASTNLTAWAPLTNVSGLIGTVQILDSTATNSPRRFYRGVLLGQ
jgi:hypothetical protein